MTMALEAEILSIEELLLDEKCKHIQESLNILKPIIRNYFILEGYTYPEADGVEGHVSDKYLRLHFNMIQLARYHNLSSLIHCMTSIKNVHAQFQSWAESPGGGGGGGRSEAILEIYETECINIYSCCLKIPAENLLSNLLVDNEINKIRQALGTIIEAFENLQCMRTKCIALRCPDNDVQSVADYLRDVDVDWKELQKARDQLPYYKMFYNPPPITQMPDLAQSSRPNMDI